MTSSSTRHLDGSNAGGQFVRTALALAVLENEPIRIENVRGDRSTPGLRHQHLAVLETMAALCDADVSGAELGAETVEFDPGLKIEGTTDESFDHPRLAAGEYAVDIGTAGSITLLFDAVIPLATVLKSPLRLTVTGGTDVTWSPPLAYVRRVKLPLLRRYGLTAAVEVDRRGFYPDGGGRATLHLAPSRFEPIELTERGPIEDVRLYSTESASLAERDVAFRQAEGALERLAVDGPSETETGATGTITPAERCETTAASPSPGSAIVLRIDHGTAIAGVSALGERGTPAERVGEDAADAANRFLAGSAPVDRHMADQLLSVLAVAGGRIRVPAVTDHVAAGCELLESFEIPVEREDVGDEAILAVERRESVGPDATDATDAAGD